MNSTSSDPYTEPPTAELAGAAAPSVATKLRRRRELLHWTQAEASRRSGVSRTVINEIEAGRRVPQTRTYEKLRGALGLALPAAPALLRRPEPVDWTERQLATLAGCLLSRHGGTLAALAGAMGVSIPAVREQLSLLGDRLAACGRAAVTTGTRSGSCLCPSRRRRSPEWRPSRPSRPIPEAGEVLVIVGLLGSPTRREIEKRRGGEDCESLLERMCRRGLLEKAKDDTLRGDPNVYRLTAVSLGALGHATLDSFQSWCASAISDPAATVCITGDARS